MCMPGSFLTPEEERLKVFWDYNNVLATAERNGIAIGRAEGRAEGIAEGRAEGIAEGRAEGIVEGQAKGERTLLTKLVLANKEKGKSPSEIADMLEIDIKMVEEILEGSC